MHTFFINPPSQEGRKLIRNFDCATESKGNYLYQPYDALILSSHFERANFTLIDAIADNISKQEVIDKIEKEQRSILIISIADTNWFEDFDFVKLVKKLYPNNPIFVFGDAFIDPNAVAQIKPFINGILANPLEVSLSQFQITDIEHWEDGPGFINKETYSKTNLKKPVEVKIRTPHHSSFLLKNYRWPFSTRFKYTTVFTAWGCPYSCSYCVVAKFPNLYRNYRDIVEELDHIKELKIKEIYIGDRSFGLPRENTISLLTEMIDRKYNFTWSTYFHPNQYDPELLELMKRSGCHTLIIGIESHNFKSLKKYGRHMKEDRFYSLLAHAKKLGIDICGDFMIGLPNETKEDILKTIAMSKSIGIDYASFNIAAPLAGSSLRADAKKDGRIKDGQEKHFDSFGYHKVLSNGVLSGDEIYKLRNLAVRSFYFNPKYLIRSFFRIKSFEHLLIQMQEMLQILIKTK